jgi:DNA polymerase type B, organellar and viral.
MSEETTATGLIEDQYSDWYGFDTENDDSGKVTLAALVHESGNRSVFPGAGHVMKMIKEEKLGKRPVVICHNLEYDLVNEFGVSEYSMMSLNYLKGRLISAKLGNCRFLDSFNHFRMSLKDLGHSLGIEKLDMDIHSVDYVSQDAWICLKAMTLARDYIASLGGRIGATSGSSAMSVWQYMTENEYMTGPIDTPWLRKGYYGGRTEIFRPHTECSSGEKNIRGYDINSMYPFCMLNEFPETLQDDPAMNKGKGMAEVMISLPTDIFYAPLPHRTAKDELWYPVGVFRGVWTYDEVRRAESMGGKVLKVFKAMGCNVMCRPFNQFIHTLYAKRKASTSDSDRLFLKVLMNSLYGKIASRNQVTRTVSRFTLMKKHDKRIEDVKWITYHRGLLDYYTPQQAYVNVCWGAMITAYARLLLHKYLMTVPPEKAIYCDTDSIYCINHVMDDSKELGQMKLEQTASIMTVVQPKAYRIDEFYKAKGVPKAKRDAAGNILLDYAQQYIDDGYTEFQAPIRFRASLNSHRGKANQWVKHSKGRKTAYQAKRLSGDRYVPPIIGQQLDLVLTATKRGKLTLV